MRSCVSWSLCQRTQQPNAMSNNHSGVLMPVTVRTTLTLSYSDAGEPELLQSAQMFDDADLPTGAPYEKRTPAHELKNMIAFSLNADNARLALAVTSPIDEHAYSLQRTRD